jgi:hypothetical protein
MLFHSDTEVSRRPGSRGGTARKRAARTPARKPIWDALLQAALTRDDLTSLSVLVESAGTSLTAILTALADPDAMARLESEGQRLLRLLGILLAVRLLRGALESGDAGLVKLALSVVPPRSEPAEKSQAVSWADLLSATAEPPPPASEGSP